MPQAILPILTNILVAAMFIGAFLVTAHTYPMVRRARWFALAFAFGVIGPRHLARRERRGPANHRVRVFSHRAGHDGAGHVALSQAPTDVGERRADPDLRLPVADRDDRGAARYGLVSALLPELVHIWGDPLHGGDEAARAPVPAQSLSRRCIRRHGPAFPAQGGVRHLAGNGRDYAGTIYAAISQASSGLLTIAAGLLVIASFLHSVVRASQTEALSDPLTGLPNRRALDRWLDHAQSADVRTALSIAIIDVDHFKRFNDRFGHAVGDEVLRKVAACLERNRPSAGHAARIGGEEFVLLLPLDQRAAFLACESMRLAIEQLDYADADPITVSIGMATMKTGEATGDLLRRADRALYRAKAAGRDRCEIDEADGEVARQIAPPALKLVPRR